MKLVDAAAIILGRDQRLFGSIRLATDARVGMINDRLIAALALLLPHCQRAGRINGFLEASNTAVRNFQSVVEAVSVPILLVSADCALVHANARGTAFLTDGAVFSLRDGRLASPSPRLQHAIRGAIRRLARDEADTPGPGVGLSVRAGDRTLQMLHLLPLARGTTRGKLAGEAIAAIFVSDPCAGRSVPRELLASLFNMTSAEINVLELVVAGRGTREIAADLNVASSTVRTHVLHLFQKTATHRRVDLVRLAHSLIKPVTS